MRKKLKKAGKNFFIIIFLLFTFIIFSIVSYSNAVSTGISSNVFRLHIIANSDSEEDQNLKYLVRDSLIAYMRQLTKNCTSKSEVIKMAKEHILDFKKIAKLVVKNNGYDYDVDVQVGNFSFPLKTYGDVSFPSGYYDALKVKIGKASGHNWWCVMFPPLCFVDVTSATVPDESKEILKESLSEEDYNLVTQSSNIAEVKFKLVEVFNSITQKVAKEASN